MTDAVDVDLSDLHDTPLRGEGNETSLDHGYKSLPFDLPVYINVKRHLKKTEDGARKLVGWEIKFKHLGTETEISIKIYFVSPPLLVLSVDGVELFKKKGKA